MKKIYLLFCALVAGTASFAQTIPNGDMEVWRTGTAGGSTPVTIHAPNGWYGADSIFIGLGQSVGHILSIPDSVWRAQLFEESTIKHGGTRSAKLITTYQDTILVPGVLSNAQTHVTISLFPTPSISGITYTGGTPVSLRPTTVSAWVQYFPGLDTSIHPIPMPGLDSGSVLVQALAHIGSKDSVIGTGTINIGPGATWSQVTANITYPTDTTDSITLLRITFTSSNGGGTKGFDSSILYVDDVTMTGRPFVHTTLPTTNVHTAIADNAIKVYPNPVNGILYIDGPKNAGLNCKLISVNGQVMINKTLTGNDATDISALAAGSYIYMIMDVQGNTLQNGKLTVNK